MINMFDKIKEFFNYRKKYKLECEFRCNIEKLYELKKCYILDAHRKHDEERVKVYSFEINLLASILGREKIDATNIPDSCIAYPNRAK